MSTKSYPRAKRVGQQIQRALSELIRRELRDPRLGMITLTDVRMSSDLSYATIYYSVLGADPHLAQQILTQAADMLRGPLGRALGIRHSPELRFVKDELIESGARLSGLINQAVKSDVARHVDDEPAAAPENDSDSDANSDDGHYSSDDDDDGHYDSDEDDSSDSSTGDDSDPDADDQQRSPKR
ncbi:30S ribosome-binding factor RbfA [Steroidobacter sp.]|uniref:30S ribosome-binding factor RbfA n=1 Tax=Steroidobacter sp. TaxID=1978227 RepID=UPI001A4792F7|nr:30S ribosome-binding factor RbfA [Steroidobacter sp.]MBL8271878.1 30S ribosome-binding factor RbfA [Steroidobacter sp.]